jgi:hypothetical protein
MSPVSWSSNSTAVCVPVLPRTIELPPEITRPSRSTGAPSLSSIKGYRQTIRT